MRIRNYADVHASVVDECTAVSFLRSSLCLGEEDATLTSVPSYFDRTVHAAFGFLDMSRGENRDCDKIFM